MTDRRFTGKIAALNQPTDDGRIVTRFDYRLPLPITYLPEGEFYTTPVIGAVREIAISGRDVIGTGDIGVPPGIYTCGVDMSDVTTHESEDGVMVMTGTIRGLSVYDPAGDRRPAWPDVHIRVSEKGLDATTTTGQ
jgi:hypothetical protein